MDSDAVAPADRGPAGAPVASTPPPLERRIPGDVAGAARNGNPGWPAAAQAAAGGDGAAQPGYRNAFRARDDEDDGWSSWWTRATPEQASRREPNGTTAQPNGTTAQPNGTTAQPNGGIPPSPEPIQQPRPPADDGPQLRRRVPQANLAAGLRRESEQPPTQDENPVVRDPLTARNALSRFQAAQRAARDAVDGDLPDGGAGR